MKLSTIKEMAEMIYDKLNTADKAQSKIADLMAKVIILAEEDDKEPTQVSMFDDLSPEKKKFLDEFGRLDSLNLHKFDRRLDADMYDRMIKDFPDIDIMSTLDDFSAWITTNKRKNTRATFRQFMKRSQHKRRVEETTKTTYDVEALRQQGLSDDQIRDLTGE